MPKLLIITMSFPYPLRAGGKIRVYNLIKQLSIEYEITVLSLATDEERLFASELRKFCKRVETVPVAEKGGKKVLHRLRCLISMGFGMPAEMAVKFYPAFRQTLDRVLSEETFDIIQVEFVQMLPYMLSNGLRNYSQQVIWVEHEVLHNRLFRRAENSKGFVHWFWKREARLTREYEMAAAMKVQNAIVVSDEEAEYLRSWNPDLKIVVIPNGVDTAYYDSIKVERDPKGVIFTGWMRHFPNLDAAHYLLKEIMPLIIRKLPEVRLYLVGEPVPEQIRYMAANIPQVIMTGSVEDIRPLIKQASVAIVPLRIGGGTHLKVLEAMISETPVVTTPVGAEGLPLKHGQHAWISRDARGLADGVLHLLENPELRSLITTEARKLVEKEYDWAIIATKQKEFYREILG